MLTTHAALRITQFRGDGYLQWTNEVATATYRVESCVELGLPWLTNAIVTNATVATVPVTNDNCGYYRIVWTDAPSTIVHRDINTFVDLFQPTPIDFNLDGVTDVSLQETHTSSEDLSNGWTIAEILVRENHVVLTPFSNDMEIAEQLPGTNAWVSAHYPRTLAFRYTLDGPWDGGAWGGVTNGYLPVQFSVSGQQHCAWVSLTPFTSRAWQINDCAYQTISREPIRAGQTE